MLRSMAIRMKEWGLLAYPRQGVHLPLNALNDWGRSGRALGQGVAAAGTGVAELADSINRVMAAGNEADIADMLDEIGRETTEELMGKAVNDWDYSWNQAYAPRVQQVLEQFSGDSRERARKMSEVYGYRYSLEGRRRMELERLHHSRRQWQKQVDAAIKRGDAEAARRWLEQGREVFVPEESMPRQLQDVQSRSLHSQWQNRLQQNPQEALQAWDSESAPRPQGEAELKSLETEIFQARRGVFSSLALKLAAGVEQGIEPDAAELEQAVTAGVLPVETVQSLQQPRRELSAAEACNWLRRIDERSGDDDEQLVVDIAFAPIPVEQRRVLLQRLQTGAQVPPQQRCEMSRRLWNMYHEGRFGCPGDEEALQSLGRLQEAAMQRLAGGNEAANEKWLKSLYEESDNWVCYQAE